MLQGQKVADWGRNSARSRTAPSSSPAGPTAWEAKRYNLGAVVTLLRMTQARIPIYLILMIVLRRLDNQELMARALEQYKEVAMVSSKFAKLLGKVEAVCV
jgi:hypothetical protein